MRLWLATLLVAGGCMTSPAEDLESSLRGMSEIELAHEPDALAIVESSLAIPHGTLTVHWVVGVMPIAPDGETIDGTAIGCETWVSWWGAQWTSGSSADGPAISYTAFAHEAAHCALWLRGEDDPRHERVEWWGAGGVVQRARDLLIAAGL